MITLSEISIPDFGVPLALPAIPAQTYSARCSELYRRAGADWVVVYADREHLANMVFLTGFEPRFEEALLVLGRNDMRVLVTGNESESYAPVSPLPGLEVVVAQSLSLMAQDRTRSPNLSAVLSGIGLAPGDAIGLAGWKYLDAEEGEGFLVPHSIVTALSKCIGNQGTLHDVTALLMHPESGARSVVDADQIAVAEWAGARASASVWRIVNAARPGLREFEVAQSFGYAGEPLSCHSMLASATAPDAVIGLRSPTARRLAKGDGITTAVGYWGGLSSRAGLLDTENEAFLDVAKTYFSALITWYETAGIGVAGGVVHAAVTEAMARGNIRPALNPGHLVSYDEWSHSPIRPGSTDTIRSGMAFQVDVIPTPLPAGQALNAEDGVVFADADLQAELAARHPEVAARIAARRTFMSGSIGVDLPETTLPMSNIPLCVPPFWLQPNHLLTRS